MVYGPGDQIQIYLHIGHWKSAAVLQIGDLDTTVCPFLEKVAAKYKV